MVTGDFMNILVSISTVMNIKLFLALDYKNYLQNNSSSSILAVNSDVYLYIDLFGKLEWKGNFPLKIQILSRKE